MFLKKTRFNRSLLRVLVCVDCGNQFQMIGSAVEIVSYVVDALGGVTCARCARLRAMRIPPGV